MRLKRERDQSTEQAIVTAAEELFLERGYAKTSTVEIAKRAGCNQALVHYYFRTKENLFQEIFSKKILAFLRGVVSLDQQDLPFEQSIALLVESHFDLLHANPRLAFLVVSEMTTNPDRLSSLKRNLQAIAPFESIAHLEKKLKVEIAKGRVRNMKLFDIVMTAASMNVMLFLARPIVSTALNLSADDFAQLVEHRRKEHVEVVLRSLRP